MQNPTVPKLAVGIAFVCVVYTYMMHSQSIDLLPLWVAAKIYASGTYHGIYADLSQGLTVASPIWMDLAGKSAESFITAYVQPPWLAASMSVIAPHVGFAAFATVFLVINAAALFLSTIMAYNHFTSTTRPSLLIDRQSAIALIALIPTAPFIAILLLNQTQCLVILSLVAVLVHGRRAPIATGLFLGLSIAMKLTPALFAVYLLLARRWKAALIAGSFAFAIAGLDVALIDRSLNGDFLNSLSVMGTSVYTLGANYSPVKLFYYLTETQQYLGAIADHTDTLRVPRLLGPVLAALTLAIMASIGVAARRDAPGERRYDALALIATVPLSVVAWNHYYAIVLLAAFAVLTDRPRPRIALYGTIVVLTGIGLYLFGDTRGILRAFLANLGLALAFGALAYAAWRDRSQVRATSESRVSDPAQTGFSTDSHPHRMEPGTV